MFKKRNIDKKVDINKDIETIRIKTHQQNQLALAKSQLSKKIHKQEKDRQAKNEQPKKIIKYGLIQKQLPEIQQKPKEENSLMNIYVKKRMEEINSKKQRQAIDTTASEILQMQKQYLTGAESKITEYDMKQIQKKLEKLAIETIKNQLQNRNKYFVQLLQNEHERMEYASKKELKLLKQDRQRLQKELTSKYSSEGRRHYIQYVKHENLNNLS